MSVINLTDLKTASTAELVNAFPQHFRLGGFDARKLRDDHHFTEEQRLVALELADREDMVTANARDHHALDLPRVWSEIATTARRLANLAGHSEFAITALEQTGFDEGAAVAQDHMLLSLLQERLAAAESGREVSRSRLAVLNTVLYDQMNQLREQPQKIRMQMEGLERSIAASDNQRRENVKKLVALGLDQLDAEAKAKPSKADVEQMQAELASLRDQLAAALEDANNYRTAAIRKWPDLPDLERELAGDEEPVTEEAESPDLAEKVEAATEVPAAIHEAERQPRQSVMSRLLGR
ncbi:hypothetical protein [Zobellella iuensis]|uniref:Uncharacterized protein n=1 Tax=Zobellella iuensis TaxID=2803811 RepID=A0ABS1QPQ1_9GAMM|nr:hypothetical protein [Zobellella iuensis]MBL1376259.1 hypothetical protein [Zobellella iuensis]